MRKPAKDQHNSLVLPLNHIAKGTYIVSLLVDGIILQSAQLSIN